MENNMYPTKNSIPEKNRIQIVNVLQEHLSNSIDLVLQAKQAHWNVKGPDFIALHKLFDEVYKDAGDYSDLIAERIVQLGGIAKGTINSTEKLSELPEYPLTISASHQHISIIAHSLAYYEESIRNGLMRVNEVNDQVTADILTEISRRVNKLLWFVEAHLQGSQ